MQGGLDLTVFFILLVVFFIPYEGLYLRTEVAELVLQSCQLVRILLRSDGSLSLV